ncbi:hypothetical protein HAP99_02130, partial [Acidithiobacillus caldus]|nr:hypothetical protein [Acidithiobacillus caldus]
MRTPKRILSACLLALLAAGSLTAADATTYQFRVPVPGAINACPIGSPASVTYTTPGTYEVTVPTCATGASVTVEGAAGGAGNIYTDTVGGSGASISGAFPVSAGETLYIVVGGGGGAEGTAGNGSGGGGGLSGIFDGTPGSGTAIVVAGGGGGGGNPDKNT